LHLAGPAACDCPPIGGALALRRVASMIGAALGDALGNVVNAIGSACGDVVTAIGAAFGDSL
jgi:phage tail tape-measure protein